MKIIIRLPYENAQVEYATWATEENNIDFFTELECAARCTVSFAAMELKQYIEKMNPLACVEITDSYIGNQVIELLCEDVGNEEEDYQLVPTTDGIQIVGRGRIGVLYGAYEWLKMQGCRWFAPEPASEIIPKNVREFVFPKQVLQFKPSMDAGRGFTREGFMPHGESFWLWMARNRFNTDAPMEGMIGFQKKLGIKFTDGGHIFEEIMNPDRVLPSGKTIWEEHSDWYGKTQQGKACYETAMDTQFCVSNEGVLNYLADEIVKRLKTTWKYVEVLNMAGFDTWGSTCQCEECKKLGNNTDQFLHFASAVREKINEARLNRKVQLLLDAYEGTSSIEPPIHDIPQNLIDAGDKMVYFPILRCYVHGLGNQNCHVNKKYFEWLNGWVKKNHHFSVVVGEYYNVTKFEDLPLLFNHVIVEDIPQYRQLGVKGIVYMHVPRCNFALRSLTHILMAELSWNSEADVEAITTDYFEKKYGMYAQEMRMAYERVEKASIDCAEWRSWSGKSILSQLLCWDGDVPEKQITTNHYGDTKEVIKAGKEALSLLSEAQHIMLDVKNEQDYDGSEVDFSCKFAVNPFLLGLLNKYSESDFRIDEDYRLLLYGLHVTQLTTLLVEYYDALYTGSDTEELWKEIEALAHEMDGRYALPGAHSFNKGLVCPDELTRSQLRNVIKRCRIMRENKYYR